MTVLHRLLVAVTPPWWSRYRLEFVGNDIIAGLIVALMLIPQGLAYATLAGMPPQYGLYASLLPVVFYALLGSSSVMSVGPVAITSLLSASALAPLALADSNEYVLAAALLAFLSGAFLLAAGMLRLGALAQLLSHPVVTGFITGAAILIIISQLKPLLGVSASGDNTLVVLIHIVAALPQTNLLAASIGVTGLLLLLLSRKNTVPLLLRAGVSANLARTLQRLVPMLLLLSGAALVFVGKWQDDLQVVGTLPSGLPSFALPQLHADWFQELWFPALIIGLLGFVESISIAQSFAQQKREPLDANAELRALGVANIGSALAGGFPVTGGFSRTLVNAEAGAHSPLSGVFSAGFVLLALWFATELFAFLPITLLAATIISAAIQLVNASAFTHAWRYDRAEGGAMLGTALGVILFGVEVGIGTGVALSIITLVWRTSRPHIAIVGRVPDTEHFRNVARHQVVTDPRVLMIRIDESLFFGNAESVYAEITLALGRYGEAQHLVLIMSSVSHIDVTALEMLLHLDETLKPQGVTLHLAEVKGPVADKLKESALPARLEGEIFLTTYQAFQQLTGASVKP
jgi:SulP family sulfate permease